MVQRLVSSVTGADAQIIDATAITQMVDVHSDMAGDPSGRLDVLCGAITTQIEGLTGRAFKQRIITEYLNGSGYQEVYTTVAPVTEVTSLKKASTALALATADALVESTDFECDGDEGVIWLLSGCFTRARGNILIEYGAGYASDANEMNLAKAAFVLQFNATWREWDKKLAGLTTQSFGDKSATKVTEPVTLLPAVKAMLQPLVRMGLL